MGSVRFERTIGESGARCPTGLGHDPPFFQYTCKATTLLNYATQQARDRHRFPASSPRPRVARA